MQAAFLDDSECVFFTESFNDVPPQLQCAGVGQGAFPVRQLWVNRQDSDTMALGVLDQRVDGVKAHGLRVDQRTSKFRRNVALEKT